MAIIKPRKNFTTAILVYRLQILRCKRRAFQWPFRVHPITISDDLAASDGSRHATGSCRDRQPRLYECGLG
jgi:hypothetical protein